MSSLYQTSNVHYIQERWNFTGEPDKEAMRPKSRNTATSMTSLHSPGWFVVLAEEVKAIIRDRYPALVWVNSAEWEVFCSSLTFGEHIEKRGFPVMDKVREEHVNSCSVTQNTSHGDTLHFSYVVYIPDIR